MGGLDGVATSGSLGIFQKLQASVIHSSHTASSIRLASKVEGNIGSGMKKEVIQMEVERERVG